MTKNYQYPWSVSHRPHLYFLKQAFRSLAHKTRYLEILSISKLNYVSLLIILSILSSCSPNLQSKLTHKTWYFSSDLSKQDITVYQDSTLNPEPLRGQQSILLLENGSLIENATNANDKAQERKGSWSLKKRVLQLNLPSNQKTYTFKVVNLSGNAFTLELSK